MAHGVDPSGFVLKRLPEILADIQAANVATFGPGVIQADQSPLGQLNGLHADLTASAWELALSIYQSLDPDQAEGARLDQIAKLRLLQRADGESDIDLRLAITNSGRARIDMSDLSQALSSLPGVTWAQPFVNDGDEADDDGVSPHSVAVAVLGGDDDQIAKTVRNYVVPGVGTYGNTILETTIDGFCRSIKVVRPAEIAVDIEIDVLARPDRNGCPPPSAISIASGVAALLSGTSRPRNGQDVTEFLIRQAVESQYPNIEVVAVRASRFPATPAAVPLAIDFFEIMDVTAARITVIPV